MNLNELQQRRNAWVSHNFPEDELADSIMGAVEEMGELAHHYLKRKQGIRGDDQTHFDGMTDAVADAVIFLAGVCTHLGVNFGDLVSETWAEVERRNWQVNKGDGVAS